VTLLGSLECRNTAPAWTADYPRGYLCEHRASTSSWLRGGMLNLPFRLGERRGIWRGGLLAEASARRDLASFSGLVAR